MEKENKFFYSISRDAHARFKFLGDVYKDHVQMVVDADGDDMQLEYHLHCGFRCYLLFLVDTSMFLDKSATYVDVVYLKYFINLTIIHEYKWVMPVWSICTQSWTKLVFERQSSL